MPRAGTPLPIPSSAMKQLALAVATVAAFFAAAPRPALAQTPPSREEARALELGKEIFKLKANCQYCHKWDASGDQGYGGQQF